MGTTTNRGQEEAYIVPENVLEELGERMYRASSPYTEALDSVTQILRNIMRHHNIVPPDEVDYRIRGRKKKIVDIKDKVRRKKYIVSSIEDLENQIQDIVGTRCVVDYLSDVYELQELIQSREEWHLAKLAEDYIKSPTETGYRSLHLITAVNTTNFSNVLVEIQIRTMLQDAWATKTHPLTYRKEPGEIPKHWLMLFKLLSDHLYVHDQTFETIKNEMKLGKEG